MVKLTNCKMHCCNLKDGIQKPNLSGCSGILPLHFELFPELMIFVQKFLTDSKTLLKNNNTTVRTKSVYKSPAAARGKACRRKLSKRLAKNEPTVFLCFQQNTTLVLAWRKTPRVEHDKNDLCCLADVCEFPESLCVTA